MKPLSIVALSLLLLGCDEKAPSAPAAVTPADQGNAAEEQPSEAAPDATATPSACDLAKLDALAPQLGKAPLYAQPELVVAGLTDACTLPNFLPDFFKLGERTGPGGPATAPLDPATWAEVFARACPEHTRVLPRLSTLPAEQRPALVYDGCGFGRFDIVARDRYVARPPAPPIPFVTYQWLLDQGATQPTANAIAKAIEIMDRREFGAITPSPNLKLPSYRGTLDPLPDGVVVHLSQDALATDDKRIATLERGKLRFQDVDRHLIGSLFDALSESADHAKTQAAITRTEPWPALLVVVADEQVPYNTIVDLMYTSGRAEFQHYAFVLDTDAFEYGVVPVEPPRFSAKAMSTSSGGAFTLAITDKAPLVVTIDHAGYEVRDQSVPSAAPERIGVRAASDHRAWDFEALTRRASEHRTLHPDSHVAIVSPDGDIPYGVVVRTYAALRGPKCPTDKVCVLPDLIATTPGTTTISMPPSEELTTAAGILGDSPDPFDALMGKAPPLDRPATPSLGKVEASKKPKVKGSLDKDILRRIVRAHIAEVRYCYQQALSTDPSEKGRVVINFIINAEGKVETASVKSSTVKSKELSTCIQKAVKRWKFPRPQGGGIVDVTYPFVLEPS